METFEKRYKISKEQGSVTNKICPISDCMKFSLYGI